MLRDGKVPPDPDGFYAYAPKAEVKKMNDAIKGPPETQSSWRPL